MKTLVIVSHPYQENSHTISALEKIAQNQLQVTIRNLDLIYGQDISHFDVNMEQAACAAADRIVYLFPIHWFNLTPMLKAYLNEVWTYGWAFGPEGKALAGKEMQVVTTAGASQYTYSADGMIESTMDAVLTPMKASALYVGMTYLPPLALYEAMGVSGDRLETFAEQFKLALTA